MQNYRKCPGLATFNTGNSVCVLDPGKIKAIILAIHGQKLPDTLTAEALRNACHADRPARIFPIKTIVEYAPSGGEAQTSENGYGPTKITGYSAKNDVWTLQDYDATLKANLMAAKNVAFDAYFVDENNVIYGMLVDGVFGGIPLSGVYPGGQDWDSSGTEANLTINTMFKDYEKYVKNASVVSCDFDVVDALTGLVYVEFVSVESGKYKLVEHFGKLDVTEFFGKQIAEKSTAVLKDVTAVEYSNGIITATVTGGKDIQLSAPSALAESGIYGIEQWVE